MLTRNEEIYDARVEKGRTLQSIADQYGISRERVRQITAKLERQKKRIRMFPAVPERMDQIEWPVRVFNCLCNEGLDSLTIEEFIDYFKTNDIEQITNLGKKSVQHVVDTIKELGYDFDPFFVRKELRLTVKKVQEMKRQARMARDESIWQQYNDLRKCDYIAEHHNVTIGTVYNVIKRKKNGG
jgi:DNA-directed RNA polymerase sigma subunit (sigma70/sigma32)